MAASFSGGDTIILVFSDGGPWFFGMARVVVPSSHGEAEVTIQGARTRPSIVYGLN